MIRLREIRKARGLTQKQLADSIGITESAIGLYENGKRKPNYEMLLRLGEVLNCSVDDLVRTQCVTDDYLNLNMNIDQLDLRVRMCGKNVSDEQWERIKRYAHEVANEDDNEEKPVHLGKQSLEEVARRLQELNARIESLERNNGKKE